MHSYAIDTEERKIVIFVLSLSSFGISCLISKVLNIIEISIPSYIDGPSTLVIFGILYWFFEKYAWKWIIFRHINFIKTPNLNGKWNGTYCSSYKCEETGKKIVGKTVFKIEQSWTKIRIISENKKSISYSQMAEILTNDNMGILLKYQYKNDAKFDNEGMHSHTGFNKLRYLPKEEKLEGDYFTDKDRQTYGTLCYIKEN